jgi:hypothetical protein
MLGLGEYRNRLRNEIYTAGWIESSVLGLRLALALQPEEVRRWLVERPADAPVGKRSDPETCPLHTYLHATAPELGGDGLGVYSSYVMFRAPRPRGEPRPHLEFKLPAWAEQLTARVDMGGRWGDPVSAAEMLVLLEVAMEEGDDDGRDD